jgi:hypothetical protein
MRMLALVLASLSLPVGAQTTAFQQLQGTSPQFSTFAGSDANLQSLVSGLGAGQAVTLVTQNADGSLQIVTFTPPSGLGAGVSRALEQARTNLIARGIAQPTGQQIAVALMGGTLATSAGAVQIPGVLTNTIPANAVQVRNESPSAFTTGISTGITITRIGIGSMNAPRNSRTILTTSRNTQGDVCAARMNDAIVAGRFSRARIQLKSVADARMNMMRAESTVTRTRMPGTAPTLSSPKASPITIA